ncbi:MAG: PASTA domain-containing protein, partial [Armatimonadota bacterium]
AGWLIALLFVVLLGAVGVGGFLVFGNWRKPPPPPPATVQVPDLIGLTKPQAEYLLQQRGLQGKEGLPEANNTVEKDQVCRQDPAASTAIASETPVLYWLSKGPVTITMPDVSTMTLDRAKQEVRALGFRASFIVKSEPSDEPKQTVIRQNPEPGALLDCETGKVTLMLSKGPQAVVPVKETWKPGSAPDLGKETVYVRIELERPAHSEPKEIMRATMKPGDKIDPVTFERNPDEQVIVRMLAGDDELDKLTTQAEVTFGPSTTGPTTMPGQ